MNERKGLTPKGQALTRPKYPCKLGAAQVENLSSG